MSIMLVNDQKEVIEKDLNTLVKFMNRYGFSWESEYLANTNYPVWLELNYRSYNNRYKENVPTPIKYTVSQVGNAQYSDYCKLLKRLECIRYNIELEYCNANVKELEALDHLNELIDNLKSWIIGNLTEYKEASWE